MPSTQSNSFRTMVARISPDDLVMYANGALAAYLRVAKKDLIGTPLEVLARRSQGEIAECFSRPETGRSSNRLVTDEKGRVFEAKSYTDGGVLDIVLDEVTTADTIGREVRESSGTPFESLTEDELRTARHPERRYLTVSFTQLRGLNQIAERLAPTEVRLMVNSFVEEASDAVFETGSTVGETSGDSILGIYGAPRYYTDHPLRAIRAACDQMQKTAQLHTGFYREGKELPPSSCGLWTGDTMIGTIGNSVWQHYTALGATVELAHKLCMLARPGEILLPEHTLTHFLRVLPSSWQHIRAESDVEPDLSDFQWTGEDIEPVPEHLRKVVYLAGPGIQDSTDQIEYYFDYLWALKVPGRDQAVPILRVVRPAQVGDSFELSEENVVTTQAVQTLGKYKLIEVLGTGGMGRVWRGVDRFGNAVAIKVLHSSETVTEAQLKRFRREAEIMGRLPHRNICRVFEMNEFDGIHYIAMEFVDGLPLADLLYERTVAENDGKVQENPDLRAIIDSLRSERPLREEAERESQDTEAKPRAKHTRILPIEQTLSLILKVCEAVQFAHEHGVLHRDLKPGNILLRVDGEPLVADFGLAKLNSPDATHSLSITGHVVGTLENMAPEQAISSKDVDERADVYSIGTILYQMLTGQRHFEASGNIVTDAQALRNHQPERPRAINSQIDPDLEIITLKALRTEAAERYRSVAALQADIEHFRRGEVITAKPVSTLELFKKLIQRNRTAFLAAAASFVVLIGAAAFTFWQLTERLKEQNSANQQIREKSELAEKNERRAKERESEATKAAAEAAAASERAKLNEKKANEALAKADDALAEAAAAHQALLAAQESGKQASAQTEEARKREKAAEEKLVASQREIEELRSSQSSPGTNFSVMPPPKRLPGFEERQQQKNSLGEALSIYNFELSTLNLQKMEKNPEEVIRLLGRAVDKSCEALLVNPQFSQAWMLKGRLHLALMEYDRAVASFEQAAQIEGTQPDQDGLDEDPRRALALALSLASGWGDKYSKGAEQLRASNHPHDQTAGNILQFLNAKPNLRRSSTSSSGPLGRSLTANEAALALTRLLGPGARVTVLPLNSGRFDIAISDTDNTGNLAILKEMSVANLAISGAKSLDWTVMAVLELEGLNLSGSAVEAFPFSLTGFQRLRSLDLSNTGISSLEFIRGMPLLERLNLSSTHVSDIARLSICRSLKQLDLGGLNIVSFQVLAALPVESLTVSPMLLSNPAALNVLRNHRNLRILRTPNDTPDHMPPEFWQKLATGAYEKSE